MAKVKAVFKGVSEEQKVQFKNTSCLLTISVGQESHEGERFAATIDLINQNFKSCTIALYDTLQRHTMALSNNRDSEFFYSLATKEGDLWLERNQHYIDKLTNLKDISRWTSWLNHNNFSKFYQELQNLLVIDTKYKGILEETVSKYLKRYCQQTRDSLVFNLERAKKICTEYVLEECTVLRLWAELKCEYEAYPSNHNEAMQETRYRFITSQHPNLLQPLTIAFRNAPQLQPQRFELLEI